MSGNGFMINKTAVSHRSQFPEEFITNEIPNYKLSIPSHCYKNVLLFSLSTMIKPKKFPEIFALY